MTAHACLATTDRYLLVEALDAAALEEALRELEAEGHRLVTRICDRSGGARGALLRRYRPSWRRPPWRHHAK